jgi:2-keto-3-deoxy-L-rhamnonate aldolase RhmA
LLAAKEKIRKATLSHGLIAGVHFVHPDTAADETRQAIKDGYRFIALGTDILFLGDSARALYRELKDLKG